MSAADITATPKFSRAERDRRWAKLRALMRKEGLNVIVVPPHTGHHDHFSANARYLTGFGGYSLEVGAVFPLEGNVTAVTVPDVAPAKWRAQQDWVDDIRSTGRAFGDGLIARLKELRLSKAKIGIAGWSNVPRFEDGLLPQPLYAKLVAEFPGATLVDATRVLDRTRYAKSDEEIEFLRRSTALAEAAIKAMHNIARPGITEAAVYAAMLAAMVERGGEVPAMIMWSAGTGEALASAGPPLLRPLAGKEYLARRGRGPVCGLLRPSHANGDARRCPRCIATSGACNRCASGLQRSHASRHHPRRIGGPNDSGRKGHEVQNQIPHARARTGR